MLYYYATNVLVYTIHSSCMILKSCTMLTQKGFWIKTYRGLFFLSTSNISFKTIKCNKHLCHSRVQSTCSFHEWKLSFFWMNLRPWMNGLSFYYSSAVTIRTAWKSGREGGGWREKLHWFYADAASGMHDKRMRGMNRWRKSERVRGWIIVEESAPF